MRVALGLPTPTCVEGLIENGSLAALQRSFDLVAVLGTDIPRIREVLDRTVLWHNTRFRQILWQTIYLSYQMDYGRKHYPMHLKTIIWIVGYARLVTALRPLIGTSWFRRLCTPLLRRLLAATNPLDRALRDRVDAVVVLTGMKDPLHDDMIRFARKRGIPSLSATQNWDNIYYKALVERPRAIGVWGWQGYYAARSLHKFGHDNTELLGMARMDTYFTAQPSQPDARAALNLPADVPIILYAAASAAFNDFSVLAELERAIDDDILPRDTLILFKRHPRRWGPHEDTPELLKTLKHTQVLAEDGPDAIPADRLPFLMRAIDGVVSPFSTMSLEAALCGRPCINVAYNDAYAVTYDWTLEKTLVHLAPMVLAGWSENCYHPSELRAAAGRLKARFRDSQVERDARTLALHIVHNDGRTFGDRVAAAVNRLLDGVPAI